MKKPMLQDQSVLTLISFLNQLRSGSGHLLQSSSPGLEPGRLAPRLWTLEVLRIRRMQYLLCPQLRLVPSVGARCWKS